MGKITKTKRNSATVNMEMRKEDAIKKSLSRAAHKRILLLRRRLSALLDEKESWETKNRDLMESVNQERKLNSELQKDLFNYQRLYHEAIISLNTYKVKCAEMVQNMSSCVKDMTSAYPHILGFTEPLARTRTRLTNQLNSLRTLETEHCPRAFGTGGQVNGDLSKKSEKRMKHKVGPMVKGVLIQKPTIRLERVMLHQPQGQEIGNNELSPTGPSGLTPITEENEQDSNLHLGQISVRRKRKHRLGSGERWRMRKQEQMEKERKIERENQCRTAVGESSDSDDQLGPIIRLQRVSGLLLSPNLLEVNRGRNSEGNAATSRSSEPETRRVRGSEDPMEGCSWMNVPSRCSKRKTNSGTEKILSPASSDSSEEESEPVNVAQKTLRSSLTDSLYKNQTFTVRRKTSSSSSTADISREVSDSPKPEPDSTNNIDDVIFVRSCPMRDSLDTVSSNVSTASVCKQVPCYNAMSEVNSSQQERGNVNNSQTTHGDTLSGVTDLPTLSEDQRRSSFCNNCTLTGSPEVREKRIRKPKIHFYPGEEINKPKAVLPKAAKEKPVTTSKKKVSLSQPSGRKSVGKSSVSKSLELPRASVTLSSVAADIRPSQGRRSGSSQKKKVPKKSSVKKSVDISLNCTTAMDQRPSQGQEETNKRSSRRNRVPTSYKESPLNVKLRRPK